MTPLAEPRGGATYSREGATYSRGGATSSRGGATSSREGASYSREGASCARGRAAWTHLVGAVRTDDGSILPLAFGYLALCLVAILICVDATSLYLEQKRLDSIADAAALAAADGFILTVESGQPRAELQDTEVRTQAQALVDAAGRATLAGATTPDGVSARVEVAGIWHPPISTLFVPDGVPLRATATSRTALR